MKQTDLLVRLIAAIVLRRLLVAIALNRLTKIVNSEYLGLDESEWRKWNTSTALDVSSRIIRNTALFADLANRDANCSEGPERTCRQSAAGFTAVATHLHYTQQKDTAKTDAKTSTRDGGTDMLQKSHKLPGKQQA